MSKGLIGCGVLVVIGLALLGTGVGSYNRLVELDEGVDSAWSQVENVYQRRADLIPNLVATVKGAKEFEQETLTQVVEARAKVGQVNFRTGAGRRTARAVRGGTVSTFVSAVALARRRGTLPGTQGDRGIP